MSSAIFDQHVINTAKVSNATHTGDVTDASGVLTVDKIKGVSLAGLGGGVLKVAATTGIPSIATAADYPTLNQSTTGNALTATTATKATNIAGGATGSLPYQTANDSTSMLTAGASGTVLKSNGAAAPSWSTVEKSMLSTALSNEITANTDKVSNITHSGDVTDTGGVLKVTKINNVLLSGLGTGILKNTTGTGVPSIAVAADFPTMTAPVGGTGITSYSIGDLLYASSSTTLDKLASIAAGNVLTTNGTNNAPSYGKVALSGAVTHITGTLPVSSGGTGLTTITGYVKGTGTSALSTSSTVPVADISGTLPVANGGTGVTSSTGSGSSVLSNSPTLVSPVLGTPSSGNLSACTGLSLTTGVAGTLPVTSGGTGTTSLTGYVKGNGTGAMSASATIPVTDLSGSFGVANGGTGQSTFTAGILKSTGGTAALTTVDAPAGDLVGTTAIQTLTNKTLTSPTLTTPVLGTPASGTLTNCTGLPLDSGVTGVLPTYNGGFGFDLDASPYYGVLYLSPMGGGVTSYEVLPSAFGGTGYGSEGIGTLAFDTTPDTATALTEGQLRWNATDKTLDIKLAGDTTLQVGQEQNIYVENDDIVTIPNGAAVYISGVSTGDIPAVKIATSVNNIANKTLGIATQAISVGGYGYITLTGMVRGLTNAAGYTTTGMTAGDEIWLSTDGKWSNTQQSFINSQIKLGHVIQVSSTQGSILVNPRIIAGAAGQRVGGIVYSDSTSYLSSSTTATTMSTYTIPATGLRGTGGQIIAKYRGRVTTASSPATRQIQLTFGPSGTPTTIFDSTAFTPNGSPTTLYWVVEAVLSRVSNTELDVFVELKGSGLNAPTVIQYTNLTGLNLDTTNYVLNLIGTSGDSSTAKAIGYDFASISWDPT